MVIELPTFDDERGLLTVWDQQVPFTVKRVFWIYNVPNGYIRAGHQHKVCEQAIFAVSGSFKVNNELLDDPSIGLYIPTSTFITLHDFSESAVALVLCNESYEISELETG